MNNNLAISSLLKRAHSELAYVSHIAPGRDEAHAMSRRAAATAGILRFTDVLPVLPKNSSANYSRLHVRPAGEAFTISGLVSAASTTAQAGARIIPVSAEPEAVADGQGTGAWYSKATSVRVVTASEFQVVADGADAVAQALPVLSASIKLDEAASHAVHFVLTRKDQRDVSGEVLDYEISQAVAFGLANLADSVLLAAIADSTP